MRANTLHRLLETARAMRNERIWAGDCYEAAAELLLRAGVSKRRGVALVHGVVTHQPTKAKMGHAWLEYRGPGACVCLDVTAGGGCFVFPVPFYYSAAGGPEKMRRYSPREASRMLTKHSHYGPWDDSISVAAHANA